jgi:hypothetical protein
MAICRIIETGATPEDYERVSDKVGARNSPPEGGQLHIAAKGEDGTIRIIEVWDSREQAEAFGERVRAARQELGVGDGSMPPIEYLELHRLNTREQAAT